MNFEIFVTVRYRRRRGYISIKKDRDCGLLSGVYI
jgi:hypothetical protein